MKKVLILLGMLRNLYKLSGSVYQTTLFFLSNIMFQELCLKKEGGQMSKQLLEFNPLTIPERK